MVPTGAPVMMMAGVRCGTSRLRGWRRGRFRDHLDIGPPQKAETQEESPMHRRNRGQDVALPIGGKGHQYPESRLLDRAHARLARRATMGPAWVVVPVSWLTMSIRSVALIPI